ncbi:MAG: class I SAM-dependent methyltransferase [Candidatus Taylorbacteria bacterium]|nr:class I SAM-dependent methyltransferase [Candidatus Taylorbacteria bacterium]
MQSVAHILHTLRCVSCSGNLTKATDGYSCSRCNRAYRATDSCLFVIEPSSSLHSERPDGIVFRLKLWVKKYPKLFTVLNHTLGTYVGKSAKQCISSLPKGSVIVNIGSGAEIIREDIINVDIDPYPGVRITADIHTLPFKDSSVDAVISESVLEHVKDPIRAVAEMRRILKPGGLLYIVVPFIIGYHSSPGDYYRWTTSGMRELLKEFKEQELGIAVGPTNALTYILREWLATLFSFNSNSLYQILVVFFMVLFAPVNLLDHFLKHYASSPVIAHLYYFIGTK